MNWLIQYWNRSLDLSKVSLFFRTSSFWKRSIISPYAYAFCGTLFFCWIFAHIHIYAENDRRWIHFDCRLFLPIAICSACITVRISGVFAFLCECIKHKSHSNIQVSYALYEYSHNSFIFCLFVCFERNRFKRFI